MKKYLLVCWQDYEPSAGLENIIETFDSIKELKKYYENNEYSRYHDHCEIHDRDTLKVEKLK